MNRKTASDLEKLYEEVNKPMTVGTLKPGELEGKTKEKGPKKSGAESTDAKKAADAPKELQGDTVDSSTSNKKTTVKEAKKMSKFDELYSQAIQEDAAPGIEDKSFDSEIGDFPPAGGDEAAAEEALNDEQLGGGESMAELFTSFADIVSKIATKFQEQEGIEETPDMIDDGGEVDAGDLSQEAVESKPAPDGVSKLTAKGSMDVKGVTVTKGAAKTTSGAGADGKLSVAKDTTLGPKTPLKGPGTGPIADGKDKNFFG